MKVRIKSIILACILLLGLGARAGEPTRVQNFEGELYLGMVGPIFHQAGTECGWGLDLGAELRYNLKKVPVSLGVMVERYPPNRLHVDPDDVYCNDFGNCDGALFGFTGEYDFRRGKAFNPFGGVAVGLGWLHGIDEDSRILPYCRLKAGLEVVHHIRLSALLTFTRSDLCGFGVCLGFVIGGRPKK